MSEHDDELVERVAEALAAPFCGQWDDLMGQEKAHYLTHARAALDELAPELRHDPPEGCEWVALPVEDVDRWCEGWGALVDVPSVRSGSLGVLGQVVDACHAAVSRRPKPEPRTEWVPWWEAVGRIMPGRGRVAEAAIRVGCLPTLHLERDAGVDHRFFVFGDGKVEVLAEDGAE